MIDVGLADMDTVGAVDCFTVTVADAEAVPPEPFAVTV